MEAAQVVVSKKENTTTVSETESVATSGETTTSEHGFTITDNAEYGSLEITFEGKPSQAVRDVLKENKFRWHKVKKVWYGKADRSTITEALNENSLYAKHRATMGATYHIYSIPSVDWSRMQPTSASSLQLHKIL